MLSLDAVVEAQVEASFGGHFLISEQPEKLQIKGMATDCWQLGTSMRLIKKMWGCGLLCLGLLSNLVHANEYQLYSLEPGAQWVEMMSEQTDNEGTYLLHLFNNKQNTILMISSTRYTQEFKLESFINMGQAMTKVIQQRGMSVSRQGYDEEAGYYFAEGSRNQMPFKLRILVKDQVLLGVVVAGRDMDAGLKLIDAILIKESLDLNE